jgi:hypothetical protein
MSAAIRIPIPERETYVPAFGAKHRDESLAVRGRNGKPLGFTVGDVLPERRFAIGENGQCLHERDFDALYLDWASRVCVPSGQIVAVASVNKYFDPKLEPIPNPEEFVNARVVNGKIIPITFDETRVEMPRGYEDRRYGADGEIFAAAKARASLADRTALAKIEALRDLLADGTITETQFATKVAAMVGGAASPAEVVAATEKPPGFDVVLPEPEASPEPALAEPAAEVFTAPCGRSWPKAHFAKNHIKFCKEPECAAARETEAPAAVAEE